MNKFVLALKGYASCFGWVFAAIWREILENCPDLKFWEPPTHPEDFLWYAERVNGRLAMLTLTSIFVWKGVNLIHASYYVQ